MQNQNIQNQHREINELLAMTPSEPIMRLHWGRYLCVMVAGFVENAVKAIYEDYAYSVGDSNVAQYVSNQIGYTVGTPNTEGIIRGAGAFSKVWADDLRSFITADDRSDAINTIMRQRNLIAHGQQSTISPAQLRDYLPECVAVIGFIENQCLDTSQSGR